jgi:uncharacterized protein (DUF58 family)
LPRYSVALKSLYNALKGVWGKGARKLIKTAALLGTALFFALQSQSASSHGARLAGIIFAALALLLGGISAAILIPPLARKAFPPRRRFPFSFSITLEGFIYIIAIFLLSLAAVNTGNNLLFIILSALLSAIIVSGVVSRNSLKRVSLSLQMPENVFVGENVSIKVSMKNLKRIFPSFSILVEDLELSRTSSHSSFPKLAFWKRGKDPASEPARSIFQQSAYFPILGPGETRSELTVQSFPHRGSYSLQGFWISTRFPFGFFRRGQRIEAKGDVLVYPAIQKISSFFHLLPLLPGRIEGLHAGQGENLFSIRPYQTGESARVIDWKATAKTGELMAREYAREEDSKFCLILDSRVHNPSVRCEEDFEKAVSFAASLASHFLKEGAELEFLTPGEYIPQGTSDGHLYRILRSLATVKYEIASPAEAVDLQSSFSATANVHELEQIFSDRVYKIIITSKPRGSFPSAIWRSSYVVFFDEL